MFCKVKYCRFPNKHTTSGHQCGICKKFGHGQMECMDKNQINNLKKYNHDKLPNNMQCTYIDCTHKHNHTSESHICSKCHRRHFENECIIQEFSDHSQLFHIFDNIDINTFKSNYNNHYIILNVGMGCSLYVKNNNGHLTSLFMQSDSWGQYGSETDDTPLKDKFIMGTSEIDYNLFIIDEENDDSIEYFKCPLCRAEDERDNVLQVKGSETNCKICLDEMATLYFPKCNHVCVCNNCFKQI